MGLNALSARSGGDKPFHRSAQTDRFGVFVDITHPQNKLGRKATVVVCCNMGLSLSFLEQLGHGVNGDVQFPGQQRHSLESSTGRDQFVHRRSPTGNNDPSGALMRQRCHHLNALPTIGRFQKVLGGHEMTNNPSFNSGDFHPFGG